MAATPAVPGPYNFDMLIDNAIGLWDALGYRGEPLGGPVDRRHDGLRPGGPPPGTRAVARCLRRASRRAARLRRLFPVPHRYGARQRHGGTGRAQRRADPEVNGGPPTNTPNTEYKVKAAFLYNFIKYTTWPKGAFEKKDSPIVTLVIGDDPFDGLLEKTFEDKVLHGRKLEVRHEKKVPKKIDAHLVFVKGLTEKERLKLIGDLDGRPILLVGETDGFAEDGAQANFYIEKDKVRFEMNTQAVKGAKLDVSSELLKLARIVETKKRSVR